MSPSRRRFRLSVAIVVPVVVIWPGSETSAGAFPRRPPAATPAKAARPPEPAATPAKAARPPEPAATPAKAARPPEPAAPRPALRSDTERLRAVEGLLDSTGWDWRQAGIRVRIGYHPEACCHWGVYDTSDRTVWIGPSAFATSARLKYVALHELAHAWQWTSGHLPDIQRDMSPWADSATAATERHADCVASLWGAGRGHYWACPPAARALAARHLAGGWN